MELNHDSNYNGKWIKKILISIDKQIYSDETLEIKISCDGNRFLTCKLKIKLYMNKYNVYQFKCLISVSGQTIYLIGQINACLTFNKSINVHVHKNINHIKDICPKVNETSYGAFLDDSDIKDKQKIESVVSLFITN